jgi:4-amino-4-deoxy-L-arabinose transferase-like glycosyltransferase
MFEDNDKSQRFAPRRAALAIFRHPSAPVVLMTLILLFVCFFGLGRLALIDQVDEGLYASTARRMIESGDWVTPRFGQDVFLDKPPLSFWCQALFISLLGPTPLAARLPSALSAFLTALALYCWARRKGLVRAGWLAAVLYVLCPLVALGLARVAMVDSLLTLWLTLAVMGLIEGYGGDRRGYLLTAASAALAVMTKGAIGFLLPCLTFGLWLIVRRDWGALKLVPWGPSLAVFLLLTLPWHLLVWWANGDLFLQEYIVRRHVRRFLGQDFGHNEPFWYYLPLLVSNMFPWSVLVPVAWWKALGRAREGERHSLDSAMGLWALWAVIVIAFFSLSRSKLPNYILPALPALMLLLAWRLDAIWEMRRGLKAWESAALAISGGLLGLVWLAIGLAGWRWRTTPAQPPALAQRLGALFSWKSAEGTEMLWLKLTAITGPALYWTALGALVMLASLLVLAYWRSVRRTVALGVAVSIAFILLVVHIVLPAWSRYDVVPLTALGARTLPALERGEPLVMYALHPKRPSLHYMLGHDEQTVETFSPETLQSVLERAGHGYVLTTSAATLPQLPGAFQQEATAGQWTLWRYDR